MRFKLFFRLFIAAMLIFVRQSLNAQTPILTIPSGHGSVVDDCAISKDNQLMISGDNGSIVKIWGLKDGMLLSSIELGMSTIEKIEFSQDKSKALISCIKGYAIINPLEGKVLHTEKFSNGYDEPKFGYARLNPHNRLLYFSEKMPSGTVNIYTLDLLKFNKTKVAEDKIDASSYFYGCRMSFHPKNSHAILDYGGKRTVLMDLKTYSFSASFSQENRFYFYNESGKIVSMKQGNTGFDILDNSTFAVIQSIKNEEDNTKGKFYKRPCQMTDKGLVFYHNSKFLVLKPGAAALTSFAELSLPPHSKYCLSPDASLFAFCPDSDNNKILLYNVSNGQFIRQLGINTFTPKTVEVSRDAKEFWMCSKDKSFKYMKLGSSRPSIQSFAGKRNGHGSIAAAFEPGLLIANEREKLILHNLKNRTRRSINIDEERRTEHDFDLMSTYVSENGKRVIVINDKSIDIYDTESSQRLGSILAEAGLNKFGACFSPDNQTVFVGGFFKFEGKGREYKVGAWSLNNLDKPIWMVDAQICALQYDVKNNAIAFLDYTVPGKIRRLNAKTGVEIESALLNGFPRGLDASGKLEKDGIHAMSSNKNTFDYWQNSMSSRRLQKPDESYISGEYGTFYNAKYAYLTNNEYLEIYSVLNGKAIARIYLFEGNDDFVVIGTDGRFDGTANAISKLYYVKGTEVITLESISEKFYSPNLLNTILLENEQEIVINNEEPENNINNLKSPPTLKMSIKEDTRNLVVVDDEHNVYVSKTEKVNVVIEASCPDDGVTEIRLYHNGKLVGGDTRNLVVEDEQTAPKSDTKTYEITLLSGDNTLKAIALNTQRTESAPYVQIVSFKPTAQPNKSTTATNTIDLYVVVVGINAYKNTKYNLNYAVADALAFKESIEKGVVGMFGNVNVALVNDALATKDGINKEFENVLSKSKKEDVFIFYYAGHGVMSGDNKNFYLVPHDVTQLYGNDGALAQKGFSAKELQQYSANIKAQKQLFILDACQSAGVLDVVVAARGAAEEKAIAQLARSTGTHWLTASGSQQFASEFKQLGHGTFTYCIIEALSGKADTGDKKVSVKELDAYLQEQVPEITAKYKGTPQYPASYGFGNDFPIILLK